MIQFNEKTKKYEYGCFIRTDFYQFFTADSIKHLRFKIIAACFMMLSEHNPVCQKMKKDILSTFDEQAQIFERKRLIKFYLDKTLIKLSTKDSFANNG